MLTAGGAGRATVSITITDLAGNNSATMTGIAVDAAAMPTIAYGYDDQPTTIGNIFRGGSTNDQNLELHGAGALAGGTVNIYDGGLLIGSTTADGTGNWTWTTTTLSFAAHNLTVASVDPNGHIGTQSVAWNVTVSNISTLSAPLDLSSLGLPSEEAAITAVSDHTGTVTSGGTTTEAALTVTGTVSATLAAGETVHIFRDDVDIGVATISGTSWTFEDTSVPVGQHSYRAAVQDTSGFHGTLSASYTLTETGPATGAIDIGSGTAQHIAVASAQTVTFNNVSDTTGTLVLEDSHHFSGTIFGFAGDGTPAHSDWIDITDISYAAYNHATYTDNSNGTGTLTLYDAANGELAHLTFNGSYVLSNFTISDDGSGHVLIIDPPVTA
jgi:hypothetical protein